MKKLFKYLRVGLIGIFESRGRSLLTMLGIIIGVGAVVMITALGKGAESYILGTVATFGSDQIYIHSGSPDQGVVGSIISPDKVKYNDYLALRKMEDLVINVTPFQAYEAILGYQDQAENKLIIGTTKGYSDSLNFYAKQGRFIDDNDLNASNKVVVLGEKVADEFFGEGVNPVNLMMKIGNQNFLVIGVMEKQGGNPFEDYDNMVFIPLTTMQNFLIGIDYVHAIMLTAVGEMDETIIKLRDVMRRLHHIDNPEDDLSKDDFFILSQEQALGIFSTVSSVLTLFIVAIASIALIVGGVGIMNIMFVAVHQRTREIGLRKAVGATNSDIFNQFIAEAIMITMTGGAIGAALGLGFSFLTTFIIRFFLKDWAFAVNWLAVGIALAVCVVIGVSFGLFPALKAARKSPIEALRYE